MIWHKECTSFKIKYSSGSHEKCIKDVKLAKDPILIRKCKVKALQVSKVTNGLHFMVF